MLNGLSHVMVLQFQKCDTHCLMSQLGLLQFIVAWLSLQSGISRDTANILLHLFKFIILTTLRLIKLALAAADIKTSELTELKMPLDI